MRKHTILAALAALVLPLAAAAQAPVTLGARLGFAPAAGKTGSDTPGDSIDLTHYTKSQIPLQLDVMYRVSPQLSVGAYGSYGFNQATLDFGGTNLCDVDGVDCSGGVLRLGLQATWAFATTGQFQPWAGAGTGWERNTVKAKGGGGDVEARLSGWEILSLQAGADYFASPKFAVGPFLMFSVGQYGSGKLTSSDGTSISSDFSEKDAHEWVQFGIRGRFDL